MIVSKFGGTSVGNFEAMQHSAEIVASNPNRRLVVISATSGTTNDLVALAQGQMDYTVREKLLLDIELRHLSIIEKLKEKDETRVRFQKLLSELRQHLDYIGRDKRWKDALYAFGELMSTSVFMREAS